ncbi:Pumilio domain-containing protein C6G9.14 [Musa troglodytarum]|uniref:Pumilio domain-containing protein C6G9.14 n=1 Tax=Musa troglodytarum TaxID=320322 RepID=A0A9E7KUT1_9LILI|nr:Pumilio domain-containing protein C6G9.14 [Musa troglodytarum]
MLEEEEGGKDAMRMGKQEEREMEMLLNEIPRATSPRLYHQLPCRRRHHRLFHNDACGGDGDMHATHGLYLAGLDELSSPFHGLRDVHGYGRLCGGSPACLPPLPPPPSEGSSSSSGSWLLSGRLSRVVDEVVRQRTPTDAQDGMFLEFGLLDKQQYKKPYLSQLQQHCPVDADLVDPYFENFPYGATKLVAGGTLGRNSHYKGNFGGGFASPINCPYPFSDVYFSSEKIRVDSKWDASKLHDSFQVLNRPMKSPPVNVGPQLVRLPGNMESFGSDDSLVIQGKGLHYVRNQWTDNLKETKRSQFDGQLHAQRMLLTLPLKYDNLTGVKGCTYYIAKDQHGCRSLQRKLDEGKHQIDMIFNGVIDHAVELMVDPFGNYLMQKLLEVCSEEQLLQILLLLKEDPADLVNISLNIHGTRAVQKLIGSLKTRQQIALVISAIKPGFLDLIKDLNGSHVLQRCLESFKVEDNKFIFDAAAKHCVDIATHRHGCCVLQKCIAYSIGEDQAELVSEISANGYELAQDPFGQLGCGILGHGMELFLDFKIFGDLNDLWNILLQHSFQKLCRQYILDLRNPLATANLVSQFEGKYVQLSVQKFSSNVVEKCLKTFGEDDRATIIIELLSVSHFDQLLQDPYANYVIRSAIENSKGSLYTALQKASLPHEAALRTNPYCKRIFSRFRMKK